MVLKIPSLVLKYVMNIREKPINFSFVKKSTQYAQIYIIHYTINCSGNSNACIINEQGETEAADYISGFKM